MAACSPRLDALTSSICIMRRSYDTYSLSAICAGAVGSCSPGLRPVLILKGLGEAQRPHGTFLSREVRNGYLI